MKLKTKFQDEDFDLGEVVDVDFYYNEDGNITVLAKSTKCGIYMFCFKTLKEMNEKFEDYEEPKKYYWIDYDGKVKSFIDLYEWQDKMKEIGNYFGTKEEAEKAVEKLKAWKRLKDKGFRFEGVTPMEYFIRFTYDKPQQILDNQQNPEIAQQFNKDLDLLFGGKE